jgi:hypothetical protein
MHMDGHARIRYIFFKEVSDVPALAIFHQAPADTHADADTIAHHVEPIFLHGHAYSQLILDDESSATTATAA